MGLFVFDLESVCVIHLLVACWSLDTASLSPTQEPELGHDLWVGPKPTSHTHPILLLKKDSNYQITSSEKPRERRGSNSRPSTPELRALPLCYAGSCVCLCVCMCPGRYL